MNDLTLYLDLETTGLEPKFCSILEVAAAVVDDDLQVRDTFEAVVFYPREKIMAEMNDWCVRTHTASGLLDEVERSPFTLQQTDERLHAFITKNFNVLARSVELAGNSVHFDKSFIDVHMPRTSALLSHHLQDVSGMARGLRRVEKLDLPKPQGEVTHRAMADVRYSLEQRRLIRQTLKGGPK